MFLSLISTSVEISKLLAVILTEGSFITCECAPRTSTQEHRFTIVTLNFPVDYEMCHSTLNRFCKGSEN